MVYTTSGDTKTNLMHALLQFEIIQYEWNALRHIVLLHKDAHVRSAFLVAFTLQTLQLWGNLELICTKVHYLHRDGVITFALLGEFPLETL